MPIPKLQSSRPVLPVNAKLDKRLIAYVAAAGAAGVGLAALAQPAEGKVVYTATNLSIGARSTVPLDLNNDGIADFSLITRFCGSHSTCLLADPAVTGNGVRGMGSIVPAGFFGVPVGAGEKFLSGTYNVMAVAGSYGSYKWSGGPWASVTNRYLGLKFVVNGQTHYGWARLSVKLHGGPTVLTGYAYETTPNTNIIEGHISGPAEASNIVPGDLLAPTSQPASLGMLARGTDGLSIWRREEDIVNREDRQDH